MKLSSRVGERSTRVPKAWGSPERCSSTSRPSSNSCSAWRSRARGVTTTWPFRLRVAGMERSLFKPALHIRYGTNRTRRITYVTIDAATASPARRGVGPTRPSSSGDSRLLHLEDEPGHIKDSHHGLCVSDFAVTNAGQDLRQGLWHHLDELVALARRFPRRELARQIEVDHLISEAGRGPDGGQPLQAAGRDACLFEQFATGARLGIFARVERARRDLPQRTACGIPELTDQEDRGIGIPLWVGGARHDRGGARMADDLQLARGAVGESHRVDVDPHDSAGVDPAALELHGHPQRLKTQVTGTLNPSARK